MTYLEVIPESIQLMKLSDEEYFSSKYDNYVSNSKLGLINPDEDGSVEKFNTGFQSSYNESFEIGTAVHAELLQPEYFEIADFRKPSGKLGLFAQHVYKYRQLGHTINSAITLASLEADYYKGKLSDKRRQTAIKSSLKFYLNRMKFTEDPNKETLYLSNNSYIKYEGCMNSIKRSNFNQVLYPKGIIQDAEVYNEYAIFADLKLSGKINKIVKFKAKLDNFTIDEENKIVTLNDIKTTGRNADYFMGNHIYDEEGHQVWIPGALENYHYYRQFGAYSFLLYSALNKPGYTYNCNVLLVETFGDHKTNVCKINNNWIKKGMDEFKKLIILVANEC